MRRRLRVRHGRERGSRNTALGSVCGEKIPRWEGRHTVFLVSADSKELKVLCFDAFSQVFILKDMAIGKARSENIFRQGGKPQAEISAKAPDAATDAIHSGELRLAG